MSLKTKIIIVILVGIGIVIGHIFVFAIPEKGAKTVPPVVAKEEKIQCHFGYAIVATDVTESECDARTQEIRKDAKRKIAKAKELCPPINLKEDTPLWVASVINEIQCSTNSRTYIWNYYEAEWHETGDSQRCAVYAMKTKSELPVSCYDFFDVKK